LLLLPPLQQIGRRRRNARILTAEWWSRYGKVLAHPRRGARMSAAAITVTLLRRQDAFTGTEPAAFLSMVILIRVSKEVEVWPRKRLSAEFVYLSSTPAIPVPSLSQYAPSR